MNSNDGLTDEEMGSLISVKSEVDWADACRKIKSARGGQYPHDWFARVLQTGLMTRVCSSFTPNAQEMKVVAIDRGPTTKPEFEGEDVLINTEEAIRRLNSLSTLRPDLANPTLSAFCSFLASRMNDRILPLGYLMAYELCLYDLRTGTDGFTGEPIPTVLQNIPTILQNLLRALKIQVAEIAFVPEFVAEIKKVL